MQIRQPESLIAFIDAFNEAKTPTERFAYAAACREEVAKYLADLDESILPMFQGAIAHEVREKTKNAPKKRAKRS